MAAPHRVPRVAVVGPLAGPRAAWGRLLTDALARLRHAPVRWSLFDDHGTVDRAVACAHEVVADGGFAAVVGHFNSRGARAVLPTYRAAGLPVVLPLATAAGLLDQPGGTVLRLCPDDDAQAVALARACTDAGLHRIAVVTDGSAYGTDLAHRIRAVAADGSTVEVHDSTVPDRPDTALVVCGVHHRAAELIRQAAPRSAPLVLASDDCDVPEFTELLGGAAAGVRVARMTGGPAARVAAAVTALANALGKYPEQRGAPLVEIVRGEVAFGLTPDGDLDPAAPGAAWEVVDVPSPTGPAATGDRPAVTVVGGGLVGAGTAAELARAGCRVTVWDDPDGDSASVVSGGLVRAFELDERARELATESFRTLWGRPETAAGHGFHRTGALVLLPAGQVGPARHAVTALVRAGVDAELLEPDTLARRWPMLGLDGVAAAVWEPAAGYVTAPVALAARLDEAGRAGADLVPARYAVGDDTPDVLVVAAGCGSPELLADRWPAAHPARTKRIRYGLFRYGGHRLPTIVDETSGLWARPDGADDLLVGVPVDVWDVPPASGWTLASGEVELIRRGAAERLPFLAESRFLLGRFGTDLFVPDAPLVVPLDTPAPGP
ncbi:FAD-dependent oxidoreductase, partial [Micromonospora echinofusca]